VTPTATAAPCDRRDAARLAPTNFSTYSSFPRRLYERFVNLYVKPFARPFENCIDLGCGSGGLLEVMGEQYTGNYLGIDISDLSIDRCRQNAKLQKPNVEFMRQDIKALADMPELHHRFDLLISYSALHLVPATTQEKFELLIKLTKPGALLAIDAAPRIAWNLMLFGTIKFLFQIRVGSPAVRLFGPIVAPNMPANYIRDLSKLNYMRILRLHDFLDMSYFRSDHFRQSFELLRWDIVPQDGRLTGRKLRMALRRR
jgi:SAM-dependent methyltransferase